MPVICDFMINQNIKKNETPTRLPTLYGDSSFMPRPQWAILKNKYVSRFYQNGFFKTGDCDCRFFKME
jgi:hypothetical protein